MKSDGCGRLVAHYSSAARFPQEHAKLACANLHLTVNTTLRDRREPAGTVGGHCTEAGLTEAAGLWGKAGQRSLDRSALVEAIEQLTRALAQIAALPATPLLRREQIKHQVVSGARAIGQSQERRKPLSCSAFRPFPFLEGRGTEQGAEQSVEQKEAMPAGRRGQAA